MEGGSGLQKEVDGQRDNSALAEESRTKTLSLCMRATVCLRLFARGASSLRVVRQIDRVHSVLELPIRIHGSPSCMLRSGSATKDAVEALPPPNSIILPSEKHTTAIFPLAGHILYVPGPTLPRTSSVSALEGPAEV
ncbi:hypothetical protein PIB30_029062 [Stylosanthes scabra]|uniref:Uncharacterized protein n=1 Tax=Stylosanthes scabra TaxID=79078 RepID=A0ABU6RBX0_9FABA|nr:hypothetical protein [Stylosanthes scabra]